MLFPARAGRGKQGMEEGQGKTREGARAGKSTAARAQLSYFFHTKRTQRSEQYKEHLLFCVIPRENRSANVNVWQIDGSSTRSIAKKDKDLH